MYAGFKETCVVYFLCVCT